MHAFVMRDIGVGGRERVADPTPSRGDVIIAPAYSGLCGTDVHMFHEGTLTRKSSLPVVMGHEFVGTVVEIGSGDQVRPYGETDQLRVGDHVSVEPLLPCNSCSQCLRGRSNLCSDWSHLGILDDGCWADLVRVPAVRATKLPDGVSLYDAALAEPLACAVNFVVQRGRVRTGETVLIVGAGPIGLLSVAMAKAAGAERILVSEPQANRRASAERVGATLTIDPLAHDIVDATRAATNGAGPDVVVEASGSSTAVAQAIAAAAPGSRVVLSGLGSGGTTALDTNSIVTKELTVMGGFASRWAMSTGLAAIAAGHVRTDDLVTSVRPWSHAEQAMHDMVADPTTCKILFDHSL
ncbi:hypothetical protein ERC79_11990 [Rhodococcus sp. ABRD24]|uniref:zinc-dependent alcohol dehydrogenase n=1 Tax=Rhodococcus sp. ABRD24 TaxID=2507582 RepID=UPI00103C7CC7|nr:alcohol dehydrogenase catalytic domain-containing protein [Rhodococcus sp. ABRD24]QBJ96607.1 hypothetical protein ERC79_11990 [Rhodococcus sp. ABRD24]